MNTDTRSFQAARDLQWLVLVVAAAALLFGWSFSHTREYVIVLAVGAALNGASYLVPLEKLSGWRLRAVLAVQIGLQVTVIALAAAFSGGMESPLYAFFLVVLLVPAVTSGIYMTAGLSAYAAVSFLLAALLSPGEFGPASSAFLHLSVLAVFPAAASLVLGAFRRRLRDRETFSTLYRISRSLGESLDLNQVLRRLLAEMDSVFSTDISSVRLLDPASNSLVVEASGSDSEEVAREQIAIRLGEGFIGWVASSGEPFITSDIRKDLRFATFPAAKKKVTSAIAAPIRIGERNVGVISCASSKRKRFKQDDLDLLVSVGSLAAAAIERAELYQQILSRGEAVIESMLDGLLVIDRESRVVMTNRTTRRLLGARPGLGVPLEDMVRGKVAEWKRLCRDIENRIINCPDEVPASFTLDVKIVGGSGDGRFISARVSPVMSQWNQVIGAVVLLEDVTDLTVLAGELSVEKSKLETVLESVVVGVLAVSDSGEVLIANSNLFNILAMARPWWWLGSPLEETIPEPTLVRVIHKAMEEGAPVVGETIILSSGRHIEVSCAPINEVAAGKRGTVVMLNDVTGIHRVEQARSDFVSMVSHELRTPLTSIKAYVDTLQRKDVRFDDETRAGFINIISRETERMTRLINDILDLSRIEAGRLDLKPTYVDLPELIRRVVARMEPQARGRRVVLDLPPGLPPVLAEPAKLEQVMLNLLGNALKYSPDGGDVDIMVKPLKEKCVVSVTDQGIGIPPEHLPYIFDKYHRASTSGDIRGAGLGLFVTKSIVEAHGGRVWAESSEGTGTTMLFTMPMASQPDSADARAMGDDGA